MAIQTVHARRLLIGTDAERTALDATNYAVGLEFFTTDTDILYQWNGTSWVTGTGGGGASDFLTLTDTPSSYSGAGTKFVRVNSGATALEFATLANNEVTNSHLSDVAQSTFKGRAAGTGTGDPVDLTATQATAILDVFTSALKGVVPASGGSTADFLCADGTWKSISGSGITSLNGQSGTVQTFAVGTSGTNFNISSGSNIHTFHLPDAGASSRGAITTGAQTLVGDKTFGDGSGAAVLNINGAAGAIRDLRFQSGGSNRWLFRVTSLAESGSNAGSNLELIRRNDTGGDLGAALTLERSTGDIYSTALTEYTSSTVVGWSSTTIQDIFYKRIGKLVWVWFHITGTSNSTNTTFTLPYTATSAFNSSSSFVVSQIIPIVNTTVAGLGRVTLLRGSSTLAISSDHTSTSSNNWSSANLKTISGQFSYEAV